VAIGMFFVAAARRAPASRLTATTLSATGRAGQYVGLARVAVSSWSAAGRDVVRLRNRRRKLQEEQEDIIVRLGRAVHADDAEETEALRQQAQQHDAEIEECETELEAALAQARERVSRERMSVSPTEVIDGRESTDRK
jgi:hypothetical protein